MRRFLPIVLLLAAVLVPSLTATAQESFAWKAGTPSLEGGGNGLLRAGIPISVTVPLVAPDRAEVLTPVLRDRMGNHVVCLDPLTLYGTRIYRKARKIVASGVQSERAVSALSGGLSCTCSASLSLEDWMDSVFVSVRRSEWSRKGGLRTLGETPLGVLVRPRMPWPEGFDWTPKAPVQDKTVTRTYEGFFPVPFPDGGAEIDEDDDGMCDALNALFDTVWGFLGSGCVRPVKAELAFRDAPCGDYAGSMRLSGRRAKAVDAYLRSSGAYKNVVPSVKGDGENYSGVLDWIGSSALEVPKDVSVLFSSRPSDVQYRKLSKDCPGTFSVLEKDCYPCVQGVSFRCSYRMLRLVDFEQMSRDCPRALSASDWWALAGSYRRGSGEWLESVLLGCMYHPEDPALSYDATMALLDLGAFDRAAFCARGLQEGDDEVFALSLLSLAGGDTERFMELFGSVSRKDAKYHRQMLLLEPVLEWQRGKSEWKWVEK